MGEVTDSSEDKYATPEQMAGAACTSLMEGLGYETEYFIGNTLEAVLRMRPETPDAWQLIGAVNYAATQQRQFEQWASSFREDTAP